MKRYGLTFVTFAALALSGYLSNTVLFRQHIHEGTHFTASLPGNLGKWHLVESAEPTPGEIRGLETRDIVKRVYSDGRRPVEVVVAYIARSSRKSAHAQEACLRGAGALVAEINSKQLQRSAVGARVIALDYRSQRHWVYYWYKMGDAHTGEYFLSSLKMFWRGWFGGADKGTAFIRVMTPEAVTEDAHAAHTRLEDLVAALVPALDAVLP